MKADYTGVEIELNEAKEVVQNAELFVQTVERVFSLDKPPLAKEYGNPTSKDDDRVSAPAILVAENGRQSAKLKPISLEEIRRQARENWLQLRQHEVGAAKGVSRSNDAERRSTQDQSHSIDDNVDDQRFGSN
jgi:hypothetical protein